MANATELPYIGELAGLATSVSWTLCGLGFAFAGRRIGAMAVNQIRMAIAVVILVAVHTVQYGTPLPAVSTTQGWQLALSGIAGLALGDLFYFHCIATLGPRIGALLMATAPVFSAWIAWPVLGESLAPFTIAGIGLTVAGIWIVLFDRDHGNWDPGINRGSRRWAVVAGLLGALGQGAGLVLAKLGMDPTGNPVDPFPALVVRMMAGTVGIFALACWRGHLGTAWRGLRDRRAMRATLFGVLFGPTLGVWLSMVSAYYAKTGVAAALSALPPVLMLPVARIAYGARISWLAVAGTAVAVAGIASFFTIGSSA